jgi:hypothetical protein
VVATGCGGEVALVVRGAAADALIDSGNGAAQELAELRLALSFPINFE